VFILICHVQLTIQFTRLAQNVIYFVIHVKLRHSTPWI